MKPLSFLLLFSLTLSISIYGQEGLDFDLIIKANPLRLFNPSVPAAQAGVQFVFDDQIAISFEYGHPVEDFSANQFIEIFDEKSEWEFAVYLAEVKYFLPRKMKEKHSFVSFQCFTIPQSYVKSAGWLQTDEGILSYSQSQVQKNVIGFSLNAGVEKHWKLFAIELFAGLGLKNIAVEHKLENAASNTLPNSNTELKHWQRDIDNQEGVFIRPHAVLGLKLGFKPLLVGKK